LSEVKTIGCTAIHDKPTHTFDCVWDDSDLWYLKKLQFAIRIKTNTTWVRLSEVETVGWPAAHDEPTHSFDFALDGPDFF